LPIRGTVVPVAFATDTKTQPSEAVTAVVDSDAIDALVTDRLAVLPAELPILKTILTAALAPPNRMVQGAPEMFDASRSTATTVLAPAKLPSCPTASPMPSLDALAKDLGTGYLLCRGVDQRHG
jgi:hypothetical protein